MSNPELHPDDDPRGGTYEVHPDTTAAIKRHLESVPKPEPEPSLPPLTREEAIARARAALRKAADKTPDQN